MRRWHKRGAPRAGGSPTDASRPHHWKTRRALDVHASDQATKQGLNHPLRQDGAHAQDEHLKVMTQPGLFAKHYGILGYSDRAGG